jgi:hypothetical protein
LPEIYKILMYQIYLPFVFVSTNNLFNMEG